MVLLWKNGGSKPPSCGCQSITPGLQDIRKKLLYCAVCSLSLGLVGSPTRMTENMSRTENECLLVCISCNIIIIIIVIIIVIKRHGQTQIILEIKHSPTQVNNFYYYCYYLKREAGERDSNIAWNTDKEALIFGSEHVFGHSRQRTYKTWW